MSELIIGLIGYKNSGNNALVDPWRGHPDVSIFAGRAITNSLRAPSAVSIVINPTLRHAIKLKGSGKAMFIEVFDPETERAPQPASEDDLAVLEMADQTIDIVPELPHEAPEALREIIEEEAALLGLSLRASHHRSPLLAAS